jgi:hypothetical protein
MARPAGRIRGVRDIRTHSRAPEATIQPHTGYMRIASLELEKFRRGQERQSAMSRVKSIDDRSREIEAEQSLILKALKARKACEDPRKPLKSRKAREDPRYSSNAASESPRPTFRLRY